MKGQDLYNVFYDLQTIRLELKDKADSVLYNECAFEIDEYKREDLDQLYDKLAAGEKLTKEERKELENFLHDNECEVYGE
jgi:hypothetical protein